MTILLVNGGILNTKKNDTDGQEGTR